MNARTPIPLRPDYGAIQRDAFRSLCRAALVEAYGTLDRGLDRLRYVERQWFDDRGVQVLVRGATAPMTSNDAIAWGNVAKAFLPALIPASAGADLLARCVQLDFAASSQISLPAVTMPNAGFISESQPAPLVVGTSAPGPTLDVYKLAVLTSLTGEMIRGSNAEQIVGQVLIENCGPALDAALFSNAAGVADLRPPGLFNGITPLTPSAATTPGEAMVADLTALVAAVAPYAGNGQFAIVCAAKQAAAIALRTPKDFPVMTAAVAAGTVAAIATPALVSATDGPPSLTTTTSATVHEFDPASAIATAGTPNVVSAPVRSYFQTDSIGLRLRWPISWALRAPGAVAWMSAVTW